MLNGKREQILSLVQPENRAAGEKARAGGAWSGSSTSTSSSRA